MNRRAPIFRTLRWGFTILAALFALMWIASAKLYFAWRSHADDSIAFVLKGRVEVYVSPPVLSGTPHGPGLGFSAGRAKDLWMWDQSWQWTPTWHHFPRGGIYTIVPLWIPFAAAAFPAFFLWRPDFRHSRKGQCARCAYDLSGLAPSALCPECGASIPQLRPPAPVDTIAPKEPSMPSRPAFTLIETAAVIACVAIAGSLLAQPGNPLSQARQSARQIKDATQIRGIHQSLVLWAQNNADCYTLPSAIDKANTTLAGKATSKDTTANCFSVLIYNGSISPELCVSPAEVNKSIKAMGDYSYANPAKAANPAQALWDPAFSADFTGGHKGNFSYSHTQPSGGRLKKWSNTFQSEEVAVCTRTPEIKSVTSDADKSAKVEYANEKTLTSKIFGHGKCWSGNAAMNDNHVVFAEDKIHPGSTFNHDTAPYYLDKDNNNRLDCWCFDEKDDPATSNNYVGIFTKAGSKPSEFTAIWD